MSVREIVLYPDAPLCDDAQPFDDDEFSPALEALVEDMWLTMETYDGVGLAAPQIGLAKQLCTCFDPETGRELVLVNPQIRARDGSAMGEEGCLSLPGIYAPVERAAHIHVVARDPHGEHLDFEADNFLARVIQHEVDHLSGKVFLDRVDILTHEDRMRAWQEARASMRSAAEGNGSRV